MLDYQINNRICEAYCKSVKSHQKKIKSVDEAVPLLVPVLKAAGGWALRQLPRVAAAYAIDKATDRLGNKFEQKGYDKAAYLTRTAGDVGAFYRSPLYGWTSFGNDAVEGLKQIDAQQKQQNQTSNVNQQYLDYISKPVSCPLEGCDHVAKSQLELNTHYMTDHGYSAEQIENSNDGEVEENGVDRWKDGTVSCPYGNGCEWIGTQSQMESHYRQCHPEYFEESDEEIDVE